MTERLALSLFTFSGIYESDVNNLTGLCFGFQIFCTEKLKEQAPPPSLGGSMNESAFLSCLTGSFLLCYQQYA